MRVQNTAPERLPESGDTFAVSSLTHIDAIPDYASVTEPPYVGYLGLLTNCADVRQITDVHFPHGAFDWISKGLFLHNRRR